MKVFVALTKSTSKANDLAWIVKIMSRLFLKLVLSASKLASYNFLVAIDLLNLATNLSFKV